MGRLTISRKAGDIVYFWMGGKCAQLFVRKVGSNRVELTFSGEVRVERGDAKTGRFEDDREHGKEG